MQPIIKIGGILHEMANINPLNINYFESFASEIEGKFNRLKLLISDRTASGNYHEEVMRTVLRNFLSKRYSIKTGFVFKDKDNVSNQIDILIIDENEPAAYIFQEGNFAVVIPEAVVATIEVKTTYQAGDFDKSVENVVSVKRLFEFPANITSIIFGYRGTKPRDKILDNWFKRPAMIQIPTDKPMGADAIMFFTSGCLLVTHNKEGKWERGGKYYHKIFRSDDVKEKEVSDKGWQISIILALIVSACEQKDFQISRRFKNGSAANRLIQMDGAMTSHSRFSFGEGLSTL